MDNIFITSTVSLRTRGPISFSFSDYIYYTNERFGRYPCAYSSHLSSRTSCTCLSNTVCKVPISPSCNCNLYGLRQSNLIQWLPHKKLVFGGFDRCYDTPVPVCDVDRSCYGNKVCHIGDRSVGGRRGELRKCLVSEEGSKRCSFVGNESEVLLSLLTEELGEECSDAREENGRLIKKTVVDKKGNGETSNRCKSKTKRVDLGVPKTKSKFEYESVVFRSREEDKRRRERRIRSENNKEDLRRKENLKALKKEEEREALLRKESANARENEERETLLRKENWNMRVREEERDDLLRREEHRERMRRDGSSCSSYYSLSSTGEYNRDTEIEGTGDGLGVELSSIYEKDSKRSDKIVSDEVGKDDCGVGMRKKRTEMGFYAGSSGAESDFGKKSEKKLTNVLIEETESRKGALPKDSSLLEVHESGYGKTGSYKSYDDRKVKSTSSIKFDEERRRQKKQTGNEVQGHSETKMKYKQFAELPESPDDEIVTSYGSQKLYSGREEKFAKVSSLNSDAKRKHQIMVGLGREDEYLRNTHMVSEASKVQDFDARKTSISERLSEPRMKKEEDNSTDAITLNHNAEKKQQSDQVARLKDERGNSQQLIKKGSSSISQIQSDSRIIKQEENVNLTYGSYTESKEKHIQTHAESSGRTDVRIGTQQMTNELVTHSGGLIGAKDGNKTRSETIVTPPSSQLVARDESHIETMGGLVIEEGHGILESRSTALHKRVLGPALHQEKYGGDKSGEAHEQPFMFVSNEDAIGSAEQMQKSSARYVGEFVEKARHEISTSEILEEKKTYESKFECEEQSNQQGSRQYVSRESESKEHHSRHSSRGYKTMGLSDETWEVDAPSVHEHSKAEVQDDASKAENAIVKRSGRSLWSIIGHIVRLKWSRSESRSTGGKAGGVSPNRSTSSDAWFSGHEVEEDGVSVRKESNMTQEAASIHQKQEKTSTPIKEDGSSTLTVEANAKHVGVDTLSSSNIIESGSASMSISFPSSETSKSNFEGSSSGAPVSESLIPLPATRLQRSPAVKEISDASEAGSSGSEKSGQPVSTDLMEKSRSEVNKLKQRKLQRKDQIPKDRFDDWEEAYRVEAEQRKMDEMFMGEALLEAKKAADNWEVPVGAVLVQGGKIIARGCNLVEELRDSTAHAEMICIREASNLLRTWRLSETTLYVTLEPCPMCAGAILQARIDTVVWGAPNKLLGADGSWIRLFPSGDGGNGLEQTDKPAAPVHPFHPKITIRRGVLASECADAMQRFFQLRRREKEKISEPSTPPSCLPISHHRPTKFFTKMHNAFNILFCL